ncbi:AAA family ATPase [Mycoplasma sp. ATU-Cv-703]|uniref:AAA family ATPase n=1 Tax=Mycoplasma sp. ATU-Cv-703 TaxID=2498595 RepID=UPI000FDCFDF9
MEFSFNPTQESNNPLKDFGRNLTDEAARGKLDPVIGRDDEIRRIIRILSRKTKNNPVLVGEPGVGKTAIAEGLAQKILSGDVPENLKDKEVIEIDIPALIAGASFQGQFEKRLKSLMKEIKEAQGNLILFIDEIHMIVGTGKNAQGGMDAAQIIKPMLARGEMRLIGATTLDEHRKYIEQDPALERRLQKVYIAEPSEEETVTILRGLKDRFESYHGVRIHDNALVTAVKLSSRYISDRFLPDKAIDLVDEAAAAIQTEMNSKPENLEKVEQRLAMLEMEKVALSSEKDPKSRERLGEIKDRIGETEKEVKALRSAWNREKEILRDIGKYKEKVEQLKTQQQRYQAEGEFEKASILLYKEIPDWEKKLQKAEEQAGQRENSMIKEDVDEEEIANVVAKWTGIPITKLLQGQREKLLTLEKHLAQRIKGQTNALRLVNDAILRSRANVNDPNKPIGSFIFMGPTGVGKTEVARALAFELFDTEKSMIRLDMSEYMEKHAVSRLVGAPPGYIGFDQGGQLTEAVRLRPYSLILLDEIEKAHPEVLNILLQVLDDGRLTDGKGKVVDFKNTIIIMTTNIGSLDILEGKKNEQVTKLLYKFLRPEFINRVDEIVVFNALDEEAVRQITVVELEKLSKRLADRNILLEFDAGVVDKIASEGYDPLFGARPIKRYIVKNLESDLARKIISNEIKEQTQYVVKTLNSEFVFDEKRLN